MIDGGDVVAIEMKEDRTYKGTHRSAALVAVFDPDEGKMDRAKIYRENSADA